MMPAVMYCWPQQALLIWKFASQVGTLWGPSTTAHFFRAYTLQWYLMHAFLMPFMVVDWVCILPHSCLLALALPWQCLPMGRAQGGGSFHFHLFGFKEYSYKGCIVNNTE